VTIRSWIPKCLGSYDATVICFSLLCREASNYRFSASGGLPTVIL